MAQVLTARVFMNGRSQHVILPREYRWGYRFRTDEVYVSRDPANGNLILSQAPGGWTELFDALDRDRFPEDFLADREQGTLAEREGQ
jgi:virulence-associated protein VagC